MSTERIDRILEGSTIARALQLHLDDQIGSVQRALDAMNSAMALCSLLIKDAGATPRASEDTSAGLASAVRESLCLSFDVLDDVRLDLVDIRAAGRRQKPRSPGVGRPKVAPPGRDMP